MERLQLLFDAEAHGRVFVGGIRLDLPPLAVFTEAPRTVGFPVRFHSDCSHPQYSRFPTADEEQRLCRFGQAGGAWMRAGKIGSMALNPYESPRIPADERPGLAERSEPWVGSALTLLLLGSFVAVGIAAANLVVIVVAYGRR